MIIAFVRPIVFRLPPPLSVLHPNTVAMPMRRLVQRWNFSAKNVYKTTDTNEREPRFARNLANESGLAKEKEPAKVTEEKILESVGHRSRACLHGIPVTLFPSCAIFHFQQDPGESDEVAVAKVRVTEEKGKLVISHGGYGRAKANDERSAGCPCTMCRGSPRKASFSPFMRK